MIPILVLIIKYLFVDCCLYGEFMADFAYILCLKIVT